MPMEQVAMETIIASVTGTVSEAIPSPVATPSPFTQEVLEEKVPVVEVKPKIKLHVAEDAICESCQ